MPRIIINVEDGIAPSNALYKLARWYESHDLDPVAAPMKGAVCYKDGIAVVQMQPTREAAMVAAMCVLDLARLHARKWRNHLGERMVWRDGSGHVK